MSNKNIYKGSTGSLKSRIKDHKFGKVKSTRNFRPLRLVGYEAYILKSDALRRENFLKTTEGRRLLERQFRDFLCQIRKDE